MENDIAKREVRLMLYEKWNYVLAIAEEQNLTRAAKRLFISQPALTLYLNRLEKELGVKLFDRSRTPILLTEAGKYYVEQMKKISASEQALRSEIRMIADPAKTLVISIGQVRGHHWLPLFLPAFCFIHPDVNIQVIQGREASMGQALRSGQVDVLIGSHSAALSDLEVVELSHEQLFFAAHKQFGLIPPACRSQYGIRSPYRISPERLDGLPFITSQVSNDLYSSYESIILANQIRPSRTISVSNLYTGFKLAAQGLGVQLLAGSLLQLGEEADTMEETMDFCVLEDMPQTRKCVAVYSKDNIKKQLILDVIQAIKDQVLPRCILDIPCEGPDLP